MAEQGYSLADRGERTRVNVGGRSLRPCGTWAAFQRHQSRDEALCEACAEAARRWPLYKRARDRYRRARKAGTDPRELERLAEEMLRLEIEYRSLERVSDTPQPPGRRWTVYRFDFENGQQYVGITQRSAWAREAEHISGDKRLRGGSASISALVARGVRYEHVIVATDLTEGEAYELESRLIAELDRPLNVKGVIR
ncbi:GIY-YIG nuclease family protein [Candidatus Poriferisodalis sp.]|uniref:GIY-YIG nuclease family protein n=1 Tax=Candidatus Poriferisodalis sp. TaxID=3101277 RepID=UPI003B0141EB